MAFLFEVQMKNFSKEKRLLPEYPSTPYLQLEDLPLKGQVCIEEKIDGASVGMTLSADGNPIIRNRDYILSKGYLKNTPAKIQFRSVFNWFYDHKNLFEKLATFGEYSVYGEWMVMAHGMIYDNLPDLFITYDLFDQDTDQFVNSDLARSILTECGFNVISRFEKIPDNWDGIVELTNSQSNYAIDQKVEGVYIKISDDQRI